MTDGPPNEGPPLVPGKGKSLKRRATETGVWTLGGYGLSNAFRLGSNLILARLLAPEAFGVIAIAFTIQTGLAMFSDVGLNQNVIQSDDGDDPDFLNTLWTIQIIRGFVIAAGLWAIAAAFAFTSLPTFFPEDSAYRATEIPGLIALIAFISVTDGFTPTKAITAQRHMQIGRITAIQLAAQVIGSCCVIATAFIGWGVWSFAFGSLLSAITNLTLNFYYIYGVNNVAIFHNKKAKVIYNFGKWIFLSSLFGFFVNNLDKIIFPVLFSKDLFGLYSICIIWMIAFRNISDMFLKRVLYPYVSEKVRTGAGFNKCYSVFENYSFIICFVSFSFVHFFTTFVFDILYGQNFYESKRLLELASIGCFWPVLTSLGQTYKAFGQTFELLKIVLIRFIICVSAVFVLLAMRFIHHETFIVVYWSTPFLLFIYIFFHIKDMTLILKSLLKSSMVATIFIFMVF